MRQRRSAIAGPALALAVVFLGLLPGSAHALTTTLYAASTGSGSSCTEPTPCSFATALSQADALTGPVTIDLASGTYTASSTSSDGHSGTGAWLVANANNQPVSIVGAGEASTIINTSGSASTTAHTIVLDLSGENTGGATISDLTVQIPATSDDDGVGSLGYSEATTISDVAIDGAPGLTGSIGLREASATVDNVTISLPQVGSTCTSSGTCNEGWYQANGEANADGLSVTADNGIDVNLDAGGFNDLRVFADVSGVELSSGASSPISYPFTESEIVMSGANSQALSLIDTFGVGTVDAAFDTLTDSSSSGTSGAVSSAYSSTVSSDIALTDSVVWGFGAPLSCFQASPATAALSASYSNFDSADDASTGCTPSVGSGDIDADPDLVPQPNGDETLAYDSPAIDAGDPTIAGPLTDLDGNQRPVDTGGGARVDMGAFEYQSWRGPTAVATATTGDIVAGAPATFSAAGSTDPNSLALGYSWSFDDGTTASGATVQHVFATAGVHRATLTVTNTLGLTNATTTQVTIVSPTPTAPSSGSPSTGSPSTGSPGAGVARAGSASVHGMSVRELVTCAGAPGAACALKVTLSISETLKRGKVVAISASAGAKPKKRTLTVGTASITLGAGRSRTVDVRLTNQARRLLRSHPTLAVKLTVSSGGRVLHTQVLRFKRQKPKKAH